MRGRTPKSMSNPIYWVRKTLDQSNSRSRQAGAIDNFNERWNRLVKIHNLVLSEWVTGELSRQSSNNELIKLKKYIVEAKEWNTAIDGNIDDAKQSHLSKYSTQLKNMALTSMKLNKKN